MIDNNVLKIYQIKLRWKCNNSNIMKNKNIIRISFNLCKRGRGALTLKCYLKDY